ncbi:adenylate/guanylate cyclase domain-containing protein [Lipingzhangella sp. LS1_29]|uniref:Adenylate/guanylate cyclase domain-containing protein n=1 Tax=Lipingzhangella rawalii TaxID=2055835 RepID=A0ABU2H526_9ACTN|nr:adenylate/guanylate cyclase domain-containing protein [Lipingzhangella rawalii]MDS1270398.1 adenylate/guanylate cyclase domain-containing protein [Lipingzhangella rawalii]
MPSRPDPEEIEAVLLGGPARYTRAEAVARSGATPEFARRVWRALGFVTWDEDAAVFTDRDVEALSRATDLLRRGVLTEDAAVRLARAMGQTMARLADWQTSVLSTQGQSREDAGQQDGASPPASARTPEEALGALAGLAPELLPDVEELLVYAWRRQLAASATRTLAVLRDGDDHAPNYFPLVVGFADLASFTTLSRDLDEVELAELVEQFEATAADDIASGGGRVVKTLGDAVLYVANSADQAADVALRLAEGLDTTAAVPDVRVGLAYGPVLALLGDVFGTTVNRASRLTSFARPGTVLIDEALAEQLTDDPAYLVTQVRARHAHGLGQLQPYALRRSFEYPRRT